MFEEIEDESFAQREERILAYWKKNKIFESSLEQRKDAPFFSFYDGPPFATGLPHYGHLLAGTIKDVVPRFKTMEGYRVPRRFGWDCHGLPVEQEIEKAFGLSGAPEIEKFGIAKFNEECRKIVLRYTDQWKSTVERMGRWVDFSKCYKSMDRSFMESVWWVFSQVFEKGLVYEGHKVMPFSAKLGTPLSNFEASENYQDVDDPSVAVKLELLETPNTSLLVWTTTPWTLISNLAATVNEKIEYVLIEEVATKKRYILAKALVGKWFKDEATYTTINTMEGRELVGMRYKPLFSYFSDQQQEGAFRVIAADFVSLEDGTGIVHTAPAFGETDFYACQEAGISIVCPVDQNGRFTEEVPEYEGQFVKDADKAIIARLKEAGNLFYRGTIRHRYPFCWRSDTPLIYKAITTWFLDVSAIKKQLCANNEGIHWVPNHLKEGRFGKWLEGARDWAISRNRYWGTPIPLWRSESGKIRVVGSVAELEELTGQKIDDLHRHFLDDLTFTIEGEIYHRIPEVFDCWFDAGSMPYAQNHYPFENKQETEESFPADFIAEGVDQTRGWFYTLNVLSTALFDRPAFKNVVANGILLAEDGNKMSKRLKNYPEPELVMNKYGADAVRLYMLHSPAVRADDLRFSERGVEQILRQILIPLWNAHTFFITYARIYEWTPPETRSQPEAVIDQWMIAKLYALIEQVKKGMDVYELSRAVEPFVEFVDQLTNWYIRRSRRRFWAEEDTPDRRQAFETLHWTLIELCKVAAPFIPFLSEAIYRNLKTEKMADSVHLCDYPAYSQENRSTYLEEGMELLQTAVSLGHALRKEQKIKVRQPLQRAHLECHDHTHLDFLRKQAHLIAEELNVHEVVFHEKAENFVEISIKPNFRVLGKKVGKYMRDAQKVIANFDQNQINQLVAGDSLEIKLSQESFTIDSQDIEVVRQVREDVVAMHGGAITVALDVELNEILILEGIARELVNKINTMRRQNGYAVTDRIHVHLHTTDLVKRALEKHNAYISQEILALEMQVSREPQGESIDINGEPTAILIKRV